MLLYKQAELRKFADRLTSDEPVIVLKADHPYAVALLTDLAARYRDVGQGDAQQEVLDDVQFVRAWLQGKGRKAGSGPERVTVAAKDVGAMPSGIVDDDSA